MLIHGGALSELLSGSINSFREQSFPVKKQGRRFIYYHRSCIQSRALTMYHGSEPMGENNAEEGTKTNDSTVAQYVVIRKDLVDSLKWPLGSVLAQACHAAVAAVWLFKDHPHTLHYCDDLDSMTTVTLEVKGETQLLNLAKKLEENGISHKLWIEQPENFPTCLATKPYPKSEVAQYFKKLKLCK